MLNIVLKEILWSLNGTLDLIVCFYQKILRNIANKNSTIIISTFEMNFAKLWVEMYWCIDYNYVQYSKFYKINK